MELWLLLEAYLSGVSDTKYRGRAFDWGDMYMVLSSQRLRTRFIDALAYVVLSVASLVILLPILWVLRVSLGNRFIAYKIPPEWFFWPTLDNYRAILQTGYFRYLWNSFSISLLATVLSVGLAFLAAYSIARYRTGGATLSLSILAVQMIPPIVLALPLFILVRQTGLLDTYFSLIACYVAFNLPILVWMLVGFVQGIPEALEEAALVDGCTRWQALSKITLPLAAPGIVAAVILSFILCWNEFVVALILTGNRTRTAAVALSTFETHQGIMIAELCAATILAVIPIITLSLFIQKYLVSGLTFGAVK